MLSHILSSCRFVSSDFNINSVEKEGKLVIHSGKGGDYKRVDKATYLKAQLFDIHVMLFGFAMTLNFYSNGKMLNF